MARKLVIDIEALVACEGKLRDYADELECIQNDLQKAMDTLISESGWKSSGSEAFKSKYETSWVEGIKDRHDVMIRMADHLMNAQKEYQPIVEKIEKLRINV